MYAQGVFVVHLELGRNMLFFDENRASYGRRIFLAFCPIANNDFYFLVHVNLLVSSRPRLLRSPGGFGRLLRAERRSRTRIQSHSRFMTNFRRPRILKRLRGGNMNQRALSDCNCTVKVSAILSACRGGWCNIAQQTRQHESPARRFLGSLSPSVKKSPSGPCADFKKSAIVAIFQRGAH
jgi:hypothetical protein